MRGSGSGRKRRNRRIQEPGGGEVRGHGLHLGVASEGEKEGKRRWRFLTGQHYDTVWVNGSPRREEAQWDSDGPQLFHAESELLSKLVAVLTETMSPGGL